MNKFNQETNRIVNYKLYPKTVKSGWFPLYRIVLFFLFFVLTSVNPVEAKNVTFSWRANPPQDYVIGYRLYYGASSRLNANGTPKNNFSYDYYIDFSELKRCIPGSNGTSCRLLNLQNVNCSDLYEDVPRCTVSNLSGQMYFALTAYNAQAESGFTPELKLMVDSLNPDKRAAFQQVIAKLLLNE